MPARRRREERRPSPSEAVAARRLRAAEEALDVRVRATRPFLDLEVRNPVHRTSYRVVFPGYPGREGALCTCSDFARRGLGTCKHLEAAWDWLSARPKGSTEPPGPPERPTDELWRCLDERIARWTAGPPATIRELEQAGALLYEEDSPDPGTGSAEEVRRPKAGRRGPTSTSRARP